jgi:hypothetical protein
MARVKPQRPALIAAGAAALLALTALGGTSASADTARHASTAASLPGDNLPFASAIVRATHNSYSGDLASGTRGSITYQLDHGVRFLELDTDEDDYATDHDYELGHGGPGDQVDHSGGNPASNLLRDWLQQISAWSAGNPTHAPIVVMLDLKDDLSDNGSYAAGDLSALNSEIESEFGSQLARPEDYPNGLPDIGALRGRVIALLSGNAGSRGAYLSDVGDDPAVAVNTKGQVVEVHDSGSGGLWFWSGVLGADGRVTWLRHEKYDSGTTPAVTMNDAGVIVEVHKSQNNDGLYYHVGKMDAQGGITWSPSHQYDSGALPTVRFTDSAGTQLREIHRTQSGSQNWDWNGTLDAQALTVAWDSATHGTTSDPRYDSTTSGTGSSQVHVWTGADGASSAQTLLYSTSRTPQGRIRYEQVAYVDTQPGDSTDLQNGALVHSASSDDTDFITSNRLAGHVTRSWDFDSASDATDPFPNEAATNYPWASWYQDLLNGPSVQPYVVQ